jgi:hypothetical protein
MMVVTVMLLLNVQMVTLTVMVMAPNVFMVHGHVMAWMTVQMVLMKLTVLQ